MDPGIDLGKDAIAAGILTGLIQFFQWLRARSKPEQKESYDLYRRLLLRVTRLEDARREDQAREAEEDLLGCVRALQREARRRNWNLSRTDEGSGLGSE